MWKPGVELRGRSARGGGVFCGCTQMSANVYWYDFAVFIAGITHLACIDAELWGGGEDGAGGVREGVCV